MKNLLPFILLFFSTITFSQKSEIKIISQDEKDFSVDSILQNLILEGVDIIDIQTNFSYKDNCMGYFFDPAQYLGMEQGMILSTGTVNQVNKPSKESDYTSIALDSAQLIESMAWNSIDSIGEKDSIALHQQFLQNIMIKNTKSGDPDLSNEIEGLKTFDSRVITIEFVPTADTFYYRYVFASEEYDEYVCSPFNDIFAFYVYSENKPKVNTALVPVKNIPVSINNINNGNPNNSNCEKSNSYLYHKNNGNENLVYDGFTKVLDIRFKVTPGKKHFIKIAIADASDQVLDSAVMIENSSIFSYFKSFELFFDTKSFAIKERNKIEKILKEIKQHPNSKIQLIGHSDIVGGNLSNLNLSKDRVNEVKNLLIKNGVMESQIIVKFKGELMPRYNENWKNRRVEIFILGE